MVLLIRRLRQYPTPDSVYIVQEILEASLSRTYLNFLKLDYSI